MKDLKLDKVVKVERLDSQEPVYDLSVPTTQSFFADGILVHNCSDPSVNQYP